jgi:chromosome segregation ATPase
MRAWRLALALCMLASIALAACGGDDEPTADEARTELCTSLDNLQTEFAGLVGLGLDASIEELREQWGEIQDAFGEVIDAAGDVESAETGDLEQARDDLNDAIDDLDDNASLADALSSLQAAFTTVQTAWEALRTATDC